MASLRADTTDSGIGFSLSPHPQQTMEPHGLMSGLPADYLLVHFHRFHQVKAAAKQVFDSLAENQDGNQFIVVLGLSETARQRLDSGEDCLNGISFRFMWEENAGLIKIIPTGEHENVTDAIRSEIGRICLFMGISRDEIAFGMSTTYKSTVGNKGKQPDQCFWSPSRYPGPGQQAGWPTLVIETGVSESLRRLREDAHWWFHNSLGQVRIVLVISICRRQRTVIIEKWQLAPPGTPNPLTRNMLNQLANIRPPLVQQPVSSQQPYPAREIQIDPVSVQGAPLTLNFEAVFDRARKLNETEIVLNANDLCYCTRFI